MNPIVYDLSGYADISRLVTDKSYSDSKSLKVKHQPQVDGQSVEKFHSLYVIKYDKRFLNASNYGTLGLWRSVITDGKSILCFAPPKSLPMNQFVEDLEDLNDCTITEFAEGTMVNLFYNLHRGEWEVATRSSVGARCRFYDEKGKTFRSMFVEAMNQNGIEFGIFDKDKCYSFVLQHPENRIVVPFAKARLVLTHVYSCKGSKVSHSVPSSKYLPQLSVPLLFSKRCDYEGNSLGDLSIYFGKNLVDYKVVGAMVYNVKTGQRTKVRNPTYEYVRQLKGNSPKLQFQYYCLRQCGRVKDYLRYYPESGEAFGKFRETLHAWTRGLWRNYIMCYVDKSKQFREFPYEFRPHMSELQRIYMDELRVRGGRTTLASVIAYVSVLEPARLMYAINYPLRQAAVDEKRISAASS